VLVGALSRILAKLRVMKQAPLVTAMKYVAGSWLFPFFSDYFLF
jgi:hypothetical protein